MSHVLAISVTTTGPDPEKHRIVQISGVAFELLLDEFRVVGILDLVVNPGDDVEVNCGVYGLTRGDVNAGMPIFSAMSLAQDFLHLPLKRVPEADRNKISTHSKIEVVMHNWPLVLKFLGAEAVRLGRNLDVPGFAFCTMNSSMKYLRTELLGELCDRLDLPIGVSSRYDDGSIHDAFRVAVASAACYRRIHTSPWATFPGMMFLRPGVAPNREIHTWDIWRAVNGGGVTYHGNELQKYGLIRSH